MAAKTPIERMEAEANRTPIQLLIASFLVLAGVSLIIATLVLWVVLADKAADYYAYERAIRDSATAGSDILSQQSTLEAYSRWLMPLPFLGIALLLLGIASMFGTIVPKLRLRTMVLATVLPALRDRRAG